MIFLIDEAARIRDRDSMTHSPSRMLTRKVLGTVYEPMRMHTLALQHTLQSIIEATETQELMQERGARLELKDSSDELSLNGNRQGIYILFRELIRDALNACPSGKRIQLGMNCSARRVSVFVEGPSQTASIRTDGARRALEKIAADMHAGLREEQSDRAVLSAVDFQRL